MYKPYLVLKHATIKAAPVLWFLQTTSDEGAGTSANWRVADVQLKNKAIFGRVSQDWIQDFQRYDHHHDICQNMHHRCSLSEILGIIQPTKHTNCPYQVPVTSWISHLLLLKRQICNVNCKCVRFERFRNLRKIYVNSC